MTAGRERSYGGHSMVAPLRRVIVRSPDEAFFAAEPGLWHYAGRPDRRRARREHDAFVALLRRAGAEVILHDAPLVGCADALFVHDPALVTDAGAVVLRMGKELRRGEEDALAAAMERAGVRIVGRLRPPATAEGGDPLWLDAHTLAVGRGFRTNEEGLRQLATLLEPLGVRCLPVPLPVGAGRAACLHLMSLISLVDDDLAVAHTPLLPVPFVEELQRRRIEIVEVPAEEMAGQAANVLALAPRRCLMLEGNPVTARRLRERGCEVLTYVGAEISRKAEGGPTCLTRPLLRAPVAPGR